ncbi:uncharacterized protein [Typha latifolia]|uniref:uncharacterized protein n=1 Tax=Typha latifolia TaxID=4733 RepID=UPI003C2CA3F4
MDIKPTYLQASPVFPSAMRESLEGDANFYCTSKEDPLAVAFHDPLCKLNLKETSDMVKAFPMITRSNSSNRGLDEFSAQRREGMNSVGQRRFVVPSTPGRPLFSFSPGHLSRKSIPSKWENAEKWLISSSCHESPAHVIEPADPSKISKHIGVLHQKADAFTDKMRLFDGKALNNSVSSFHGAVKSLESNAALHGASTEAPLKDKFADNVEPIFTSLRCSEPTKESFLFRSSHYETMIDPAQEVAAEVHRRDVGTDMTPLGSSTTSRCHTPIKNPSPARHNTPASKSGPLVPYNAINISELKDCHFAKLELSAQYNSMVSIWSSREEEEEEVSKSLRHLEISGGRKSIAESRACAWEEEERTKSCIRYQREEARIQAWVNLQCAKAEAQSRKLEVKIQNMRSNSEEKLMKRMASVRGRAEELRAAAQLQHSQQLHKASEHAQKVKNSHLSGQISCGCFPCNNNNL